MDSAREPTSSTTKMAPYAGLPEHPTARSKSRRTKMAPIPSPSTSSTDSKSPSTSRARGPEHPKSINNQQIRSANASRRNREAPENPEILRGFPYRRLTLPEGGGKNKKIPPRRPPAVRMTNVPKQRIPKHRTMLRDFSSRRIPPAWPLRAGNGTVLCRKRRRPAAVVRRGVADGTESVVRLTVRATSSRRVPCRSSRRAARDPSA